MLTTAILWKTNNLYTVLILQPNLNANINNHSILSIKQTKSKNSAEYFGIDLQISSNKFEKHFENSCVTYVFIYRLFSRVLRQVIPPGVCGWNTPGAQTPTHLGKI